MKNVQLTVKVVKKKVQVVKKLAPKSVKKKVSPAQPVKKQVM